MKVTVQKVGVRRLQKGMQNCDECTSLQQFVFAFLFLNYRNPASAQHISSSDRLTIYFHAVLSKDFKFNLEEDLIFIRAGGCLGDWENNLFAMSVSRLVKFFWSNF